MIRRMLLVAMAAVLSYALTAGAGYVIYTMSSQYSEMQLSHVVRLLGKPLIALVVGALVGVLSKDHPILTALAGLAPWAALFYGRIGPGLIMDYLVLGAIAAFFVWKVRNSRGLSACGCTS